MGEGLVFLRLFNINITELFVQDQLSFRFTSQMSKILER